MKKSIKLLTACLIIAMSTVSCGSDDGPSIDNNLFGTWTKVRSVLRNCANPNDNNVINEVCTDQVCETLTMTDDLRYEMTTLVRGQAQTVRGQIQIGETQINFLPDNSTGNDLFSYTVTASSLTLTLETVVCAEDFVYSK